MTCHNTTNVATASFVGQFNTGVSDGSRRTSDLPLCTLRCNATGQVTQTTDPGRALITGRCKDIGRFKVPGLRGLSARAPYFHDGSAATLKNVVEFYNTRFNMQLTDDEKESLDAFLSAL